MIFCGILSIVATTCSAAFVDMWFRGATDKSLDIVNLAAILGENLLMWWAAITLLDRVKTKVFVRGRLQSVWLILLLTWALLWNSSYYSPTWASLPRLHLLVWLLSWYILASLTRLAFLIVLRDRGIWLGIVIRLNIFLKLSMNKVSSFGSCTLLGRHSYILMGIHNWSSNGGCLLTTLLKPESHHWASITLNLTLVTVQGRTQSRPSYWWSLNFLTIAKLRSASAWITVAETLIACICSSTSNSSSWGLISLFLRLIWRAIAVCYSPDTVWTRSIIPVMV